MDVEKLIEEGARALWKASALNIAGVRDLDAEWGAMSSGDRDPYITGSVAVIRRTLEWAAGEATKFLVGDPKNGVPLRNPMPHEIAERLRSLASMENTRADT